MMSDVRKISSIKIGTRYRHDMGDIVRVISAT
jgi:hypothetical protein